MNERHADIPLSLEPISGPPLRSITLVSITNILGRGGKSTVVLTAEGVSREHLSLTHHEGAWYATDLASRNGTKLGSVLLPPGQPTPLQDGDSLEIKPWTFLVRIGGPEARSAARIIEDETPTGTRLRTTDAVKADSRIRQQFESLLRASALLHSAKDEPQLLDYLLQTALGATGFERAAVIRRIDSAELVEIVAQRTRTQAEDRKPEPFQFSRSLLRAAANGPHAVVTDPHDLTPRPDTMVRLDIAAAACTPIRLSDAVWGYLYLDSGSQTPPTAANELLELVRSLSDIASLALFSVKQHEVRKRLESLQSDFEAAAEIQGFLLPPSSGRVSRLEYAVRTRPGRIVSGDIFDVADLEDGRVAVLLGDVQGKGLGAGLVMASVHAFLHSQLRHSDNPGDVVQALNTFISRRIGINRIISLWLGIFDTARRVLTVCDAGHGYCIVTDEHGTPAHLHCAGGTFLGANAEGSYLTSTLAFTPKQRLIVFSDGVVEQRSASGEQFGIERLVRIIRPDDSPTDIVQHIVQSVEAHAGASVPADDLTTAAIRILP